MMGRNTRLEQAKSLDCAQEHRSLTLTWMAPSFSGGPKGRRWREVSITWWQNPDVIGMQV